MTSQRWLLAVFAIFSLIGTPVAVCVAAETTHTTSGIYTPIPPYPMMARRNIEQGFGLVRVTCDGVGKVAEVKMVRSTGYDDLDENVLSFARAHWHGPPNTRFRVPVDYRLSGSHSPPKIAKTGPGEWSTPMPHYPHDSVRFLESGSGVVKVVTDANGQVCKADMAKSTGVKRLDDATVDYAIGLWKGPPKSTREVAVRFTMNSPHY